MGVVPVPVRIAVWPVPLMRFFNAKILVAVWIGSLTVVLIAFK
jgi:hypothetical protein